MSISNSVDPANQPRQIVKNTALLGAADLIGRFGQMVLAFLIARTVHAAGLGIYDAATAYYGLLVLAGGMGVESFLIREIAKDRSQTSRYLVHASALGIGASLAVAAILLVLLPHLGFSPELSSGMSVIMLAIVPGTLITVQTAVFIAHQRVEFVTLARFVATGITILTSSYLLANGFGVVSLLVVFVAGEYLIMLLFFYCINRYLVTIRWQFELRTCLALIRDIRVFTALSLLAGFLAQPEIIILSLMRSETEVGFYSAAVKLALFWQFISQIFMTNVYPVLSHSYRARDGLFDRILDKSMKYLLALCLPLTVGLIAVAEPIIDLVYGPGFGASVLPLRVLSLSIPAIFISAILWRVLAACDRQDLVLRARIVALFVRLGGGVLLISWLAPLGGALAATFSLTLQTILLWRYTQRAGIQQQILRAGWRFAVAALAMGALTWTLSDQLPLWSLVSLGTVTYIVLVLALRSFSADDVALFRQITKHASH